MMSIRRRRDANTFCYCEKSMIHTCLCYNVVGGEDVHYALGYMLSVQGQKVTL